MDKVIGDKGGGGRHRGDFKNPNKATINATVTKDDLKAFGKDIVDGMLPTLSPKPK
jgi:hypothetical protein